MPYIPLQGPLSPQHLDALLAIGWYRMQQHVFTTNVLQLEDSFAVPVFWARIVLADYTPPTRLQKLRRRGQRFTLTQHDAVINAETEAVYAAYHAAIDFDAGPTAASCLLESHGHNFFPARMWQLRDNGRLIACSYFDEGETGAAGILSFFHPDYSRYSPGLWLYLESVMRAYDTGRTFFYPGYIAWGWAKFDYKLLAGTEHMELWDAGGQLWVPYALTVHAKGCS
jgi:arginine-tRNA-protein transferase